MKKTFCIIICFSFLKIAFGQTSEVFGKVRTTQFGEKISDALITLFMDSTVISGTVSDTDGNYKINIKKPGTYTLVATSFPNKEIKTILVSAETKTELNFYIQDPCEQSYTSPIKCPEGLHTDNILPIVYGLPNKKMERKAAKGKISLGGCIPSCEKYYCKMHKKAF